MSDHKGPWEPRSQPPPPETTRKRPHLGLWVWLIAAAGAGVWALSRLLPGAVSTGDDWSNVAYGLGLVAIVSAGLLRTRTIGLRQGLRYVAVWIGLLAVLGLGYSYRGELGAAAMRIRSEFAPEVGVNVGSREMLVTQDDHDQFVLIGQVDGQTVRFVVDTGASDIVLSPADARRLGVDVDGLSFSKLVETANGSGRAAPFTAQSLAIGQLRLTNVAMTINAAPMSNSLLGTSFLKQLDSFQVRDGRLDLKW